MFLRADLNLTVSSYIIITIIIITTKGSLQKAASSLETTMSLKLTADLKNLEKTTAEALEDLRQKIKKLEETISVLDKQCQTKKTPTKAKTSKP